MNYSELLDNVRNYTEVTSDVLSNSVINVFITNIENKIDRAIDGDYQRRFATTTFEANNAFLDVSGPEGGFRFARALQLVETDGTRTWLEQKDTTFIDEYNVDRVNNTGTPKYYANWDNNTLIVAPTPDSAYTIELWYNKTPDHLSSSTTTTWLSTNAPEVLIYGTTSEAFSYLKNPPYVQLYEQKYAQAVQNLAQTQMGRKRRDEYGNGVLRIPMKSVTP